MRQRLTGFEKRSIETASDRKLLSTKAGPRVRYELFSPVRSRPMWGDLGLAKARTMAWVIAFGYMFDTIRFEIISQLECFFKENNVKYNPSFLKKLGILN